MRRLRLADLQVVSWKNGGGRTAEVAISPPSSTLGEFDWRISMATIEEDGPFSIFEGIDRTIMVLDGDLLSLQFEDRHETLRKGEGPFRFDGGSPVFARCFGSPVMDLNVMSQRGRAMHEVHRFGAGVRTSHPSAPVAVIAEESSTILIDGIPSVLETWDTLLDVPLASVEVEVGSAIFVYAAR